MNRTRVYLKSGSLFEKTPTAGDEMLYVKLLFCIAFAQKIRTLFRD